MNPFIALLLATLCATSHGQTIKSLGYNTTNGQVVLNTGTNTLTFTNETRFTSVVRIGTGNARIEAFEDTDGGDYDVYFLGADGGAFFAMLYNTNNTRSLTFNEALTFSFAIDRAQTRTNMGLPLPALTNTSNVTAMRALSGSTNANHPFNGSVSVVGTNNTNTLVFSNGILQSVQ
jgi:hypothetical protein